MKYLNIPAQMVTDSAKKLGIPVQELSVAVCGGARAIYYRFKNPGSWRVEELAHLSLLLRWDENDVAAFIGYFFPTEAE